MYQIKFGKVWKSIISLSVCFYISLLSIDCVAQPGPIFSEQNDINNLTALLELPEQLYEGSYLEFPNSFAKKEFRYTDEGVIWVYFYETQALAKKDMLSYAERGYKISKEESSVLAEHFGCIQKQKEGALVTVWFTIDSYIIGIMAPSNKMGQKQLIDTAERIISDYKEKINQMFSTPEKCFETYLKAVAEKNSALIIACMYNDESEKVKGSLTYLKVMIPYLSMMKIALEEQGKQEDIKFDKAEIISSNEARLPIVNGMDKIRSSNAITLLSLGTYAGYSGTGKVWIPFKKIDERWGIDLVTLQELAFQKSQVMARRAMCTSNLKQIGLALHMYAADNSEKFPEDLSSLYPHYISTPKLFKCPSDKTISEIKEIKPGTQISYVYVKGLTEKSNPQSILAYDASAENHDGEGRNVLFLDGHVKWCDEKEFQELLSKSKRE